jgi:hypothetical protein
MVNHQLTENEKNLLNLLGRAPDTPMKSLVTPSTYRRTSTIVKKISQFRRDGMVYGPLYRTDYGRLCTNPLHMLYCIVECGLSYQRVTSYLKTIESLITIYPVLSPHKELLNVLFLSSNDAEIKALLNLLKDHDIISDFLVRVSSRKRTIENPNFSGDLNPALNHLLEPCDIPNTAFGHHDTHWNECDLSILPYLQAGFNEGKLVEILKAERKLEKPWTYHQIKYSHRKMVANGLIWKSYVVFPLPFRQCVDFNLFLKTENGELTQKILCNFARGERVTREWALCGTWGYAGFASHPLFLTELMHKLDRIKEITEKELYQLRSTPQREHIVSSPPELKYFDFETQTLKYPYYKYKEKIKETLDEEQ